MLLTAKTIACVRLKKFMVPAKSVQVKPLPTNTTLKLTIFWYAILLQRYLNSIQCDIIYGSGSIMGQSLRTWQWFFFWLPQFSVQL